MGRYQSVARGLGIPTLEVILRQSEAPTYTGNGLLQLVTTSGLTLDQPWGPECSEKGEWGAELWRSAAVITPQPTPQDGAVQGPSALSPDSVPAELAFSPKAVAPRGTEGARTQQLPALPPTPKRSMCPEETGGEREKGGPSSFAFLCPSLILASARGRQQSGTFLRLSLYQRQRPGHTRRRVREPRGQGLS